MLKIVTLLNTLLSAPLSVLMKSQVVPEGVVDSLGIDTSKPIFYIIKTNSLSDKITIARACKNSGLPNPAEPVIINGQPIDALLSLENPKPLLFGKAKKTTALKIGATILAAHQNNNELDAQLVPVTIVYGREPGKEKANLQSIIADAESPSWLRKIFMVIFSGRSNFIRFSKPVSIREMSNKHDSIEDAGHKLIRVARFHFYRQKLSATGPRMWDRQQMFNSVLSAQSIKKAIDDDVNEGKNDKFTVKKEAKKLLDEIAADYRNSYIRLASRFMNWLWSKLYSGIQVNNAEVVRDLAHKGHEIIYVPCHRSHMDYLLLSYVLYQQGLVPPHIAAGINLNFGPVGPVLRRGGAFYLRRSFKGNKLYATVFREYLGQLFMKGYSVEYFIEGGRSRTGRLLTPKTGMIAMTIQAMLRGIDRPVTFVPVYIGYEHVMEVSTYLKELKGTTKKAESMFGVFKAFKNLRDYGYGYVNFGEPVMLKPFLTEYAPQWKDAINPSEAQKPQWLTPVANALASKIMTSINQATALSATTLSATALLAADKHTLTRGELESQLDLYLELHRQAKYASHITLPDIDAKAMVDHLITLKKVDVASDNYGELISLNAQESVLMTYYRNNTIHLFAVPSLLSAQLLMHKRIPEQQLIEAVECLYPLFKDEWFLGDIEVPNYVKSIINAFVVQQLISRSDEGILTVPHQSAESFKLQLLANVIRSTLQRYAIVLSLITHNQNTERNELEDNSQLIAKRLSVMHGIKAPEFFDKKVLSLLIGSLKDNGYVLSNDEGQLSPAPGLPALSQIVTSSLQNDVVQSIIQVIKPH